MTRRQKYRPGDTFRVPLATTSEGTLVRDAVVTARRVVPLTCGCTRVETDRPGPAGGELAGAMHLSVDRCTFHAANDHQPEAVRVDVAAEAARAAEADAGTDDDAPALFDMADGAP